MTDNLILTPNIDAPDEFYAALLAAHDGLDDAASAALNARLILILANQVGGAVFRQALEAATRAGRGKAPDRERRDG